MVNMETGSKKLEEWHSRQTEVESTLERESDKNNIYPIHRAWERNDFDGRSSLCITGCRKINMGYGPALA